MSAWCCRGYADHDKCFIAVPLKPTGRTHSRPMTLDTIFDLASLTKPIATTTSIMKLMTKVSFPAGVSEYLPGFGQHGKDVITVEDLLLHVAVLIQIIPRMTIVTGWDVPEEYL